MFDRPLLALLARPATIVDDVRTVRGVEVHARRVAGTGLPPVVCVHGMVVSSRYFVPTMRELAGTADVWAPDLPGFGARSGALPGDPTVDGLADWLVAWMDRAGVGPALLLANSFGCQIAVDAAVRAPDAVSGLVLNGPTTDPEARGAASLVARWVWGSRVESSLQLPLLARDYLDFGTVRAARMLAAVLDDAIEEKLPDVRQPAVVVRGERDAIAPAPWAEEVVRLLPRGRLVTVPGAGHTLNFTHPTELAAVVAEELAPR